MRLITVRRPGPLVGAERVGQAAQVVDRHGGAGLDVIGLAMPRRYSTCAPSIWRVRSPIHRKWAEVSYQRPEVESIRVIACSSPAAGPRARCRAVRLISAW